MYREAQVLEWMGKTQEYNDLTDEEKAKWCPTADAGQAHLNRYPHRLEHSGAMLYVY
jgi:hypothetical protein